MRLWPFEQLPTFLFGDHSHIAASQRAQSLIVYYFLVLPSCLSSTCSITCFDAALSEASIKSISANTSSQLVRMSRAFRRRSEEHTSELQSLMRISYAVFCLKKTKHAPSASTHQS